MKVGVVHIIENVASEKEHRNFFKIPINFEDDLQ